MSDGNFVVIAMSDVPTPPMKFLARKHAALYAALEKLPAGEVQAIKLAVSGHRELKSLREGAVKNFRRRGRRVLSSRNAANTELYLWLQDESKKAVK